MSTPREPASTGQDDFFRSRLEAVIDLKHPLAQLARRIDWDWLAGELGDVYCEAAGQPPKPIRLMAGLLILKHMRDLSDEVVVEVWQENPYFQDFTGEEFFQHRPPITPSSLSHFRKRMGADRLSALIKESLRVAFESKALKASTLSEVIVDTTVQPKNVAHPTDARLLYTALVKLGAQARRNGIRLRQSYVRVGKKALIRAGRYAHAKQMKRMHRELRFLRKRLGRVMRDIRRKSEGDACLEAIFHEPLALAERIRTQKKRQEAPKVYSWHAPEVECIGKGKARQPYEFGCKASVSTPVKASPGGVFVLHAAAVHGRPYDGKTLKRVIGETESWTGAKVKRAFVDQGYRGHECDKSSVHVYHTGLKRVPDHLRKRLRRRAAVEPVIGHLKDGCRMGRNFLKDRSGDRINVVLAAAGFNFRQLARWFRKLLRYFRAALICAVIRPMASQPG